MCDVLLNDVVGGKENERSGETALYIGGKGNERSGERGEKRWGRRKERGGARSGIVMRGRR